jgi:hypothetical protein
MQDSHFIKRTLSVEFFNPDTMRTRHLLAHLLPSQTPFKKNSLQKKKLGGGGGGVFLSIKQTKIQFI